MNRLERIDRDWKNSVAISSRDVEFLLKIAGASVDVRAAQRDYFRSPNGTALAHAKTLEAQLDALTNEQEALEL